MGTLDELLEILSRQAECYSELLRIAQEIKFCILRNDIPALQKLTARENGLVNRLQGYEKQRMLSVNLIIKRLGLRKTPTMTELLEYLPNGAKKEELARARRALRKDMDALKEFNEQNRALLENSLEYVDFSLNVLKSAITGPAYAGDSGTDASATRPLFEIKA